jgi:nitroimidazol reductase NimA-like FMN-containing flavoprotein (pyridoxamine 5'-phosphate oxidase superfamily)
MNPDLRALITRLLDQHRIMTLATNRPDGWPQATTVSYVNDDLILYCYVARVGQKYANIRRDSRVSIAIAGNFSNPLEIQGLSLAAKAAFVEDKGEFDRVSDLFLKRYPEYVSWGRPNPALSPMVRMTPELISVLDYSKGFGHSDLVTVSKRDLRPEISQRSHWFASNV